MRKKVIIAALAAVAMSITCANATTNITGATNSGTTYTVKPERVFGTGDSAVGYRKYDNFVLDDGHVLNMMFYGPHKEYVVTNGIGSNKDVDRAVGTFINLVKNKVQINGVLNSVDKDSAFYNGHAIFIAPGGFAVGANGVVNVGQLHVATPSTSDYNKLIEGYDASLNGDDKNLDGIRAINNVSAIKQDSNANIDIKGKVFTYDGIDLRGKTVTVDGNLVNGVKNQKVLDKSAATTLFNNLVGTDAKVKTAVDYQSGASLILIKSQKKDGGIVTGTNSTITNGAGGGVYLTNEETGTAGIKTQGKIYDANFVRLYNQAGDLNAASGAIEASRVEVSNAGKDISVAGTLTGNEVQVANVGTGKLTTTATMNAKDTLVIRNANGSSMEVGGALNGTGANTTIAINNDIGNATLTATIKNTGKNATTAMLNRSNNGTFTVGGKTTNNGNLKFSNEGKGGMSVTGEMTNKGTTYIVNSNGKMTFEDTSKVTNNGQLYILGKDKSIGIYQGEGSVITNKNGDIVLKNASGTKGLSVQGTLKNEYGTIAINNHAGYMDIGGTVDAANGNLGIINRTGSTGYSMTGEITAKNANLKQNGEGDMNVGGQINHNGRVNVIANQGMLNLTGGVLNTSGILGEDGGFYAVSRMDGRGVDVAKSFTITGTGEVLIKNVSGENGLNYQGNIHTDGYQATLLNDNGDMNVNGSIETQNNRTMIRNRGGELNFGENTNVKSGQKGLVNNKGNRGETNINENAQFKNMDLVDKPQK